MQRGKHSSTRALASSRRPQLVLMSSIDCARCRHTIKRINILWHSAVVPHLSCWLYRLGHVYLGTVPPAMMQAIHKGIILTCTVHMLHISMGAHHQ